MNKILIILLFFSCTMWAMEERVIVRNLTQCSEEYKKEFLQTYSTACTILAGKDFCYRIHDGFGGSAEAQLEKYLTNHVYIQKDQLESEIYQARQDALYDILGYTE